MGGILKFCIEKGVLLDKESFDFLSGFEEETAKDIIDKFVLLKEKVINRNSIFKNVEKIQTLLQDKKVVEKIKINFGLSFEISRERYIEEQAREKAEKNSKLGNVRVLVSAPNTAKKIVPGDFTEYFRARFHEIRNFVKDRNLDNLSSINKLTVNRQSVSVIGAVLNKRVSKSKNILLDIEDLTGQMAVLINKDKKEVYDKAKGVLIDDIIGIKGFGDKEILFANDIIYPDSFLQEKVRLDRDECVAFISDVHAGSTNFLEENFAKFIKWLNLESDSEIQRQEAARVKYLLITGDTVDGVGVFPGQEERLAIKDIRKQYQKLADYLKTIRKDIQIIMCPGQHDCVRVAEPQPQIGIDYAPALYDIDNLLLVSNPAMIEIKNSEGKRGIKILMYHGASMIHFVNEIDSLRLSAAHKNPSKVVKEMLKRRHLGSMHSLVTYIPNPKKDYLVISDVPDVINTGDFHRTDVDFYNGITIVCSSCWQSITPFEEKVGNVPDPCKVPIMNLKTGKIKIMDFS
jgi:DNA polymerase II small subunit